MAAAAATARLGVKPPPHSSSRTVLLLAPSSIVSPWNVARHKKQQLLNHRRISQIIRVYCSRGSSSTSSNLTTFLISILASLARLAVNLIRSLKASQQNENWDDGRILGSMALLSTSAAMVAKSQISPVIVTLRANPTFMSGLLAWMVAQASKVLTTYAVYRRFDLKMLVASGGMPSSHSALCLALTTSVALSHGVSDALFPVCLGFSLIVMYDATGVRRHAGMQAQVLNLIINDLFQGHPVSEKKLKELLGHTPLQVIAGALVGIFVGWWCSSQATPPLVASSGIVL